MDLKIDLSFYVHEKCITKYHFGNKVWDYACDGKKCIACDEKIGLKGAWRLDITLEDLLSFFIKKVFFN